MAFTQSDLETLERAYVQGIRSVTLSDGKTIVYSSEDEFARIMARVQKALAASAGRAPGSRVASVSKGV